MHLLFILGLLLAAPAQLSATKSAEDPAERCFQNHADSIAACNDAFVRLKAPREQSEVLVAKAMLQARAKEYAMAITALRQALSLTPRDPQVHLVYAWALDGAGDHLSADREYSQASMLQLVRGSQIQLDETAVRIIRNLAGDGDFYYAVGQGFERIGQKPDAKAFYLEAATHYEQRASPAIINAYNAAIRVDPSDAATHYKFAHFWKNWDAEHVDEAIRQMEEAVRLGPNNPNFHYELAQLHLQKGDSARAIPHLHEALQLRPNWPEATHDLEIAIISTGDVAQETTLVPDTTASVRELRACVDGDGSRSEIACRRALKLGLSPHNAAVAHTFLASQLSGDPAITEYHAAIEAYPNYALAYLLLAHGVAGRLSSAPAAQKEDIASLLTAAAKLRPDWVVPRQRLAWLLWSRKRYDEAIAEQREAVAIDPDDSRLISVLQKWQSDLASYHDDLKHAAASVQAKPYDAMAHQSFAAALAVLGRADEARNEYRAAYKLDPHLGYSLASGILYTGFAEVACEIYPHVRLDHSPEVQAAVLESDLDACSRMFPTDTVALTRLAELQMIDGNATAAQRSYEEALRRDSGYFESHPLERSRYDRARTLKGPQ